MPGELLAMKQAWGKILSKKNTNSLDNSGYKPVQKTFLQTVDYIKDGGEK